MKNIEETVLRQAKDKVKRGEKPTPVQKMVLNKRK